MACLLGLCVLFYYGAIHDVNSRHQSLHDEGVDEVLVAQSRSVGRVESAVELPAKVDTLPPDYANSNPAGAHRITGQAQVSIEESLDPDVDPGMFYTARSSQQKNTGAFLDIDGEPGDLQLSEIPAPQNVGPFLDADGIDSHFDVTNESIVVNTGKYLDPDGLE